MTFKWPNLLLVAAGALCLAPFTTTAHGLALGIAFALAFGNPIAHRQKEITTRLLSACIVGLGAGMNLKTVAQAGLDGLLYTAATLAFAFAVGTALMRMLRVERDTGVLITVGTAICGGSAIAAIAPVLRAKAHSISVALAIVFLLNGIALLLFPPLGHWFHLTERQFGLWSALAIHDTSSVVGATVAYGGQAAQVGTTVKLARALWIFPITIAASAWFRASGSKAKYPWFILGFLGASAAATYLPSIDALATWIAWAARRGMVLTLFFVGLGLSRDNLRQVGARAFASGILLWLLISATFLAVVAHIA